MLTINDFVRYIMARNQQGRYRMIDIISKYASLVIPNWRNPQFAVQFTEIREHRILILNMLNARNLGTFSTQAPMVWTWLRKVDLFNISKQENIWQPSIGQLGGSMLVRRTFSHAQVVLSVTRGELIINHTAFARTIRHNFTYCFN